MSEKGKTPPPHHSMKWIFVVILWLLALYAALLIVRNTEKDPETPALASRPPVVLPVKHKGVCKSPECITLAHQLHNWRDISVDPCQDFYKAACGKYNEHTLVDGPRFFKSDEIFTQLVAEYLRQNRPSTSKSENAMKVFFHKCEEAQKMNQTAMDLEVNEEILKIAKQLGSWPMLTENWDESGFDLNDVLTNMTNVMVTNFGLFNIDLDSISINFKSENIKLETKEMEMEMKRGMTEFLLGVLQFNGTSINISSIKNDVEEIMKLSKELSTFNSIPFITTQNRMDQFQEILPMIDFERIMKNLMNEKHKDVIWDKVKEDINVPLNHPYFSNQTGSLGHILTTTKKRALANVLFIQLFLHLKETELRTGEQRKNYCAELVKEAFPVAALRVYARNHHKKENLKEASEMVEDFRESLIETFLDSTWLHESTKQKAIRKVELMKKEVGYPKEMEVPGALDNLYESLNLLTTDSYLVTYLKTWKFNTEQSFDAYAQLTPFTLGFNERYANARASYFAPKNSLFLSVPFLDDPIFDSTFPKYAKVASIGAVIGHEMGHGFDVTGRKRDEKGEVKDWWTPEDSTEYDSRAQCLIDRFNNYDDPDFGKKLNGSTTIKEHASDIIGVQLSLRSYNKVDFANEPSIFGFEDEKPDKLFFHLTALNWCRQRERTPLDLQLAQVHPTSSFRVNGIFSNMKEFAEAFSCPVGSPMNPEKKCELF